MELRNSETITINRSDIKFNPKNIKIHTDEQIRKQLKNFKKVGVLGGIVFNKRSGNLIDGARRVSALDSFYKYNPDDPSTDYTIKVEMVDYDEKTEKEQLVFMAAANTKPDMNILATFIDEVDYDAIGLSESDYKQVMDLRDIDIPVEIPEFVMPKNNKEKKNEEVSVSVQEDELRDNNGVKVVGKNVSIDKPAVEEMTEEELLQEEIKKNVTKVNKEYTKEVADARNNKLSMLGSVRFSSEEEKERFCEMFGIAYEFNITIDASDILKKVDDLLVKLTNKE